MPNKEMFKQKEESGLAYLTASKALPQGGLVPTRQESIYQSIYDERFFLSIDKASEKKFSRSGLIWVCSTFTKELYDALGLNLLYGEITDNMSDSQYKELIKISPNIFGSVLATPADFLDKITEGAKITLPGKKISGIAGNVEKFSTGAVFSAGEKRYVAGLSSQWGATSLLIGEAGKWDKNYPEGTYTLSSIKGKEAQVQKYIQIKINDENLAQKQLKKIYNVIIGSKGEKEFLALGYENSLLLNYRHSVFYKSVYRLSNTMQINDESLEVKGGNLIAELQKFFANIPANSKASKPYFDDGGRMRINFSWGKNAYLTSKKPNVKCKFSAQLILDFDPQTNSGKAYYFEDVRHNASLDGDLQGAKLVPLNIVPAEGGFKLEFNHLMMFENVESEDLTRRIGDGTLNAHIIYPQMLENNFSPINNFDPELFSKLPGERERYSNWVYGFGRYNVHYALGASKFSHLITGNLIPAK